MIATVFEYRDGCVGWKERMQVSLESLATLGAEDFLDIGIQVGRGRDQLTNAKSSGHANDRSQVTGVLYAVKYKDEVATEPAPSGTGGRRAMPIRGTR